MNVSRRALAISIVGAGGVALFVITFFASWFGASASTVIEGTTITISSGANAWHRLSDTRWLLLLTIVVSIGATALSVMGRQVRAPGTLGAIVAACAGLTAIFVLYRIIHHPSGGFSAGGGSFRYGAESGLYLGFCATLLVAYGGYLLMREEALA